MRDCPTKGGEGSIIRSVAIMGLVDYDSDSEEGSPSDASGGYIPLPTGALCQQLCIPPNASLCPRLIGVVRHSAVNLFSSRQQERGLLSCSYTWFVPHNAKHMEPLTQ